MSWPLGTRIDRYQIESQLGAGGMGVVYSGRDVQTGVTYAIKAIPVSTDPELLERFRREGEAQARAGGHPNVVRIHSSGTALGSHYLVMDLASGGDLAERLRRGPLSNEEAVEVVAPLAAGLEWLHGVGILHRDLKPANVLFNEGGTPQLVDFGLAQVAEAESLTQSGTILGTPAYMAPEQARGDRALLGPHTDVYGLGALLYHCLTGSPPFQGSTTNILIQVLELAPPKVRSLAPDVSPELEALCERALAKDPAQRFASAAEFRAALLSGDSGPRRGRPILLAAFALLVLVGGALTAVFLRSPDPLPVQSAVPATPARPSTKGPLGQPPWFSELPDHGRPPWPLPEGLGVGEAPFEYRNQRDGSILVWIPPGAFHMGDVNGGLDESPPRPAIVAEGFFLGKFELSSAKFNAFRRAKGRAPLATIAGQGPEHPALMTWHDAQAYCEWAHLRLPSEGEWELAAGGPEERIYPWGGEPPTPKRVVMRFPDGANPEVRPVDSSPEGATPEGCRNMSGNVPEWTGDQAWRALAGESLEASRSQPRANRGGGSGQEVQRGRTFSRKLVPPTSYVGLRVARSARSVRDPQNQESALARYQRSRDLRRVGKYQEALAEIEAALERSVPGSDWMLKFFNERATVRNYAGDHWGAVADFTTLIHLEPRETALYRERGASYRELKEDGLAAADLRRVLAIPGGLSKHKDEAKEWLAEIEARERK